MPGVWQVPNTHTGAIRLHNDPQIYGFPKYQDTNNETGRNKAELSPFLNFCSGKI